MATAVTVVIDPDGTGDYVSLNSADLDSFSTGTGGGHANGGLTSSNLVANDEDLLVSGICTGGTADTTIATISGYTTDATRTITLSVGAAYRNSGAAFPTGNQYRFEVSTSSSAIDWRVDYGVIEWVPIQITPTATWTQAIYYRNSTGVTINGCHICAGTLGAYNVIGLATFTNTGGAAATVRNTLCHGLTRAFSISSSTSDDINFYNNTVVDCVAGIVNTGASGTMLFKNNIFFGGTFILLGSIAATSANNVVTQGLSIAAQHATWSTGTTDGTTSGKLVDSGATFVTDGVQVGSAVKNTTDTTYAYVTAVDDENTLSLSLNIFESGEGYAVYKNLYEDPSNTSIFADYDNGDFRLKSTGYTKAADDPVPYRRGEDLSAVFTDDVAGATRRSSSVVFDVGFFQVQTVTRVPVIDPNGTGDYTSAQAWYNDKCGAQSTTLADVDEIVAASGISSAGGADAALVTNGSMTTTSTYTITLDVPAAYRHRGGVESSGNYYRMEVTTDDCITIDDDNFTVKNVSVKLVATAGFPNVLVGTAVEVLFENIVILVTGSASEVHAFYSDTDASDTVYFKNCTVSFQTSSGDTYGLYEAALPAGDTYIYCCTIFNATYGYKAQASSTAVMKDCLLWATNTGSGTLAAGSTNNSYSASAGLGSYNWVDYSSLEADATFRNANNGNLRLVFRPVVPADGANLYADGSMAVTTDCTGQARPSSGAFTIGAHEQEVENRDDASRWPDRFSSPGLYYKGKKGAIGPFKLRPDQAGWGLSQMFDKKRGAGI